VTPIEKGSFATPVTEPDGIQETAVMDDSIRICDTSLVHFMACVKNCTDHQGQAS